jgi:hypothetical protein
MTSILQPPRAPTEIAKRKTRVPVLKQFLHRLGVLRHDPLDHLHSFHPPAYHPLSSAEQERMQQEAHPVPPPKEYGVVTDEVVAPFERKIETLMLQKPHEKKEVQRNIAPIDPKEFLRETDYEHREGEHRKEFVQEPERVNVRSTFSPLGNFSQPAEDHAVSASSKWHEEERSQDTDKGAFTNFEDDEILAAPSAFAQGGDL